MTTLERRSLEGNQGFALVLSLLFTGIVLLIVVTTAASLATGTRQGGANERQAYQALLVAESGLNSLPSRADEYVRTTPYSGTSFTQLQSWLAGLQTQLQGTLSPGGTVTLSALAGSATTFTAAFKGVSGSAAKIVAQDYQLTPRTLPPGLRPRSGLISRPAISGNGSAKVLPQNVANTVTAISGSAVNVAALSPSATIPVTSAAQLKVGDYVSINSSTFKISAISGNTISVLRMPGPSATSQVLSGNVNAIFNALTENYTGVTSATALKISNISDFALGETVKIAGLQATIATINYSTKVATFTWSGTPPPTLGEGTAVTRDTTALSSAGNITPKANQLDYYQGVVNGAASNDCTSTGSGPGAVVSCIGANDTVLAGAGLTQSASSLSFTQLLFGMTDEALNSIESITTSPFPAMNDANPFMHINAADFEAAIKGKVSTGVLIVDGDVNVNMNGNTTFNGMIYVRGNLIGFGNGNFTVNGSIAVRGATAGVSSDILGSLQINYDAVALRTVLQNATGSRKLDIVAGSWRQR